MTNQLIAGSKALETVEISTVSATDRAHTTGLAATQQPSTVQEAIELKLPSDFPKLVSTTYQPAYYSFQFTDLQTQSDSESADLSSIGLTAFVTVLYRYTQQETIQLGWATSEGVTDLILHISADTDSRCLMQQVKKALTAASISPSSKQSQSSVFATVLENMTEAAATDWLKSFQSQLHTLNLLDLHWVILPQSGSAVLVYNTNVFSAATIQRLAGHLQISMQGIITHADRSIAQLPLLTEREMQQLSESQTTVTYAQTPIFKYIETQAAQAPEAIAVSFQDQKLTYTELNQRANQLAHYLNSLGATGQRVAVCMQPSLEIAVALLGVFKAGATYVPLDPTHPAERLTTILSDTQPALLLTQSDLIDQIPAIAPETFCIDHWHLLQSYSVENPNYAVDLDQTAYIIYTSGTTGKPKGVMTSHRNLVNYILVAQDQFGFNRHDIMPAIARFSFSITLFELLSPLVAGGQLMILERDHILDFKRMVQTLQQVTVIHASPSLLQKLLVYIKDHNIDLKHFEKLRHASSGGDLVSAELLTGMQNTFRNAEIFVIYGCSEVSCMGCYYPSLRNNMPKSRVGKPFSNVSVRLYDTHQNRLPIGVAGEIYFSGAGVTQGYLNQPELTAEKFVTIDGERFYRTGDIGRLDAEGNLEMLGRSDFQIQLRGIRIELGEIESALRQAPGVREGVVVARELGHSDEKSLVAYVVFQSGQHPKTETIRSFLLTKLPDYMIPALIVVLEAMPLNHNLKVDRRALPAPDAVTTAVYVAPRTELEAIIAEVWATTLKLERVGVDSDFFAIGGHSLLAAQVIYRLQEILELELSLSRLFETPTVEAFAEYIAAEQTNGATKVQYQPILPVSRDRDLPLSISQQQLWFMSQLEGGTIAYNIPIFFKLSGTLNLPALEHSISEIVRRHDTLRTVFPIVNGAPIQRILPAHPFPLSVIDLQGRSEAEQQAEVHRLARQEAQYPFDLTADFPIHAQLLRLSDISHVLLLTMHHIAADGWSLALFRQELTALYTGFGQETPALTELPIQYADFGQWQHQWLQQDSIRNQLHYWKQKLAQAPALLELPIDRPRSPVQTFRGGSEFFTLNAELTQQLRTLSQRTGATLFMTLLTAFSMLLSRYSGHQDLVIGTPVANRKRSEVESLIGFFINLLALRINTSGNPDFVDLLQQVRQVALEGYANQDVPFDRVVEAVQPERNLSYSPLFQVLLILQNTPDQQLQLPGLTLSPLKVETGVAKYDLTLMLEETESGLLGEFEYNSDLFDRSTIRRLIGHFQTLLQEIVINPEQPIAHYSILTAPEQHQLLVEWNDTAMSYPAEACIHQLFESQVERTPDAIALSFGSDQLTYRELNQQANQVAHYLRSLGVAAEVIVGICVERSLEMVVGLLGILKAGGSYVPLDPTYPADRLAYMIEDSRLPLLLTHSSLQHQFAAQNVQLICIDTDWTTIAQQSPDNPESGATGDNLAYTIYTSGSTGKPKGVQICHHTAVNFLNSMRHTPGLTEEDVLLAVTTISFDIAVLELYLPLMVGAQIVLATREIATDAMRLSALILESGATVLQATPATWRMLIAGGWQGNSPLKMLCGGEAMPRELADQLLSWGGSLWNMYGPTETTVWSAACQVQPGKGSVPVAGPIANTQIYVLEELPVGANQKVRPLPIGIPGEVYIGGDGLARGYLNRPELTQERFIADPFNAQPNARMYRTGDLARFRPDGSLEFLGRIDNQVKLRGFRIELGEIEAVLSQHPAVKQAVVMVREDVPGDQRLVAYITTAAAMPSTVELRQLLKEQLPAYMVPTAFMQLDQLPLTPNGKVDRRALPAPALSATDAEREFIAPRSELEQQLAKIWSDILAIQPIGITDNFFDLGGHSLSGVRMWNQIEEKIGQVLPLSTLLSNPTIEQLANVLNPAHSAEQATQPTPRFESVVLLKPGQDKPPLFLIHDGDGEILLYRSLAQRLDAATPVYGIQPLQSRHCPILQTRMAEIVAYYIQQIRQVQPQGPYFLGGLCLGGVITFEVARQLQLQGQEVKMIAILDAADVKAAGRSEYFTQQRLNSFSAIFNNNHHLKPHQKLLYILNQVQKKVTGLVSYETQKLAANLSDQMQLTLFRYCVDRHWRVPQFLQNIAVRRILMWARDQYEPESVFQGELLLFRATQKSAAFEGTKIDDTPFTQIFSDPLLGWSCRITEGVQAHDIPGGHSSMLQEPNVQVLATIMQSYMDAALAEEPTPLQQAA